MRRLFLIVLIFVACISAYAQQGMPLKIGAELDGKMKKVDPGTGYNSPTGAGIIGMFAELHISDYFSGKVSVGLNNTYYSDSYTGQGISGEKARPKASSEVKQSFRVSLEPRYYFFSTERSKKTNVFASIPVSFESAPFHRSGYDTRPELMILPSLGFRYDFAKHFGIEVSGGLGWARYLKQYTNIVKIQEMTYGINAGIRYTF